MKKILLLVLLPLILCGCVKVEEPINWDVSQNSDWEIWATGKLVKIEIIKHVRCDHKKPYPGNGCWSYYQYTFDDGTEVELSNIKDKGLVKEGSTGVLYKLDAKSYDRTSWFQWKTDVKAQVSIIKSKINISPSKKTEFASIPILINYNNWTDSTKSKPERYAPVLIKFSNDTLSVGYINNLNEWQLSINKREDNGGRIIPNKEVISWKNIDIQ